MCKLAYQTRVKLLILLTLLCFSCSPVPETKTGFYVDDKPYKGTRKHNRDYVRPYWQCVDMFKNIPCEE